MQWLTAACIVNQSFQLKEHITLPLMQDQDSHFRLFLCDMGMFSYQSGISAASFITNETKNTLSGIFFENFIANERKLLTLPFYLFPFAAKDLAEGILYPVIKNVND